VAQVRFCSRIRIDEINFRHTHSRTASCVHVRTSERCTAKFCAVDRIANHLQLVKVPFMSNWSALRSAECCGPSSKPSLTASMFTVYVFHLFTCRIYFLGSGRTCIFQVPNPCFDIVSWWRGNIAVYLEILKDRAVNFLSNTFTENTHCVPVRCCVHALPRAVAQAPQPPWQDVP
jgi:hypothetical protein